jgi:hypothetical protein
MAKASTAIRMDVGLAKGKDNVSNGEEELVRFQR